VHQDGLVHVSAMSRNFVSDPRQVAKPGDVVRVRVVSVDIPRQRISLTMRLDEEPRRESQPGRAARSRDKPGRGWASREQPAGGAMADALRQAGLDGPAREDERS
jgi:protein Tex